jgi:hypothetical protein
MPRKRAVPPYRHSTEIPQKIEKQKHLRSKMIQRIFRGYCAPRTNMLIDIPTEAPKKNYAAWSLHFSVLFASTVDWTPNAFCFSLSLA